VSGASHRSRPQWRPRAVRSFIVTDASKLSANRGCRLLPASYRLYVRTLVWRDINTRHYALHVAGRYSGPHCPASSLKDIGAEDCTPCQWRHGTSVRPRSTPI
jgi:hypothetical protein